MSGNSPRGRTDHRIGPRPRYPPTSRNGLPTLSDRAGGDRVEKDGAVTIRLRPRVHTAVGVVLYLSEGEQGTVTLDDLACAPAESGDDQIADAKAVDCSISVAVEGGYRVPCWARRMCRGP